MVPRSCVGLWAASLTLTVVAQSAFPEPTDSEKVRQPPLTAAAAARSFQLPPGFQVTVVAAEPEIRQPIAMSFDARGRLWVAENYTYAEAGVNFATNLLDRVVILEDRDGDGRAEGRKVFWDQARILTSVLPVADGAYVLCPPQLLFLRDSNHDDIPDGAPEIILDGFQTTTGKSHTFANGLKVGPDGWIWGRVGISSAARIGAPGTPETDRVEMRGGVWRYHPGRRVVEAVAHGTTNPWGLDWDALGEAFFINTVIGHLWHAVPGSHLQRMHGDDVLVRAYALMPQIADHHHFDTGAGWTRSRATADGVVSAASDGLGGGHAHAALLVYQGTNWPAAYRGGVFAWNLHGRRMNRERVERLGTGFVGRHEPDLFQSGDPWIRVIEMLEGPEGGVYLADWSDTGECHEHDGVHRGSGRIYRITHGPTAPVRVPDLAKAPFEDLERWVFDPNEWTSRMAIRALALRKEDEGRWESAARLRAAYQRAGRGRDGVRVLWALNAMGTWTPDWMLARTGDEDEAVRVWAVRLLSDAYAPQDGSRSAVAAWPADVTERVFQRWVRMGGKDSSGLVRRYLASALQRMPSGPRAELARALVSRPEDQSDESQALMVWYGIEPLGAVDPGLLSGIAEVSRMPLVRRFVARRLAEELGGKTMALERLLAWGAGQDAAAKLEILRGMGSAVRGLRRVAKPAGWDAFAAAARTAGEGEGQGLVRELEVVFGEGRAVGELKRLLEDGTADPLARKSAIRALVEAGATDIAPVLKKLANDGALRLAALVGLLELGDPGAAEAALGRYAWMGIEERPVLVAALVARPGPAAELLKAMEAGKVLRSDLTPFLAGQVQRMGDRALTAQLERVWGTVRSSGAEKRRQIDGWRASLTPEELGRADLSAGRLVFQQSCGVCHRLYGIGGDVGPDLTGSGRANLDYLLENVVDPGAVVAVEQRLTRAELKDGRVLSGLLKDVNDRTVTVVMPGESVTVARSEVVQLETLNESAMPEGLLESLPRSSVRDLIGYLMHPRQVPLP